jgi:hypothetical protein
METTFFEDYTKLIDSFEALTKTEDNPFFKSKFVPLKVILPIVKKHCRENHFIFMQYPLVVEGKNTLHTSIEHKSGRIITGSIEIVAKDATDPQKIGGGLTYMRRYSLTCMFGLEEEDDDGNKASETKERPAYSTPKVHTAEKKYVPAYRQKTQDEEDFIKSLDAIK